MISLVLPTYTKERVERANTLYESLKKDSGVEVEVIVVCDNPEVAPLLKHDVLVSLPFRVGFTRATNIGEKFARYENVWWIDDYVTVTPGWGKIALEEFWTRFPDGMGILELSGYETDCPKSISTRSYVYSLNGLNLLWPEYLHCGDTEMWYRSTAEGKFHCLHEPLWTRNKIFDECKAVTDMQRDYDVALREEREANGWPMTLTPNLQSRMKGWAEATDNPKNIELYENLYLKKWSYNVHQN